jgi:(p)ppGpp synthase/HD superfamily hydrolase
MSDETPIRAAGVPPEWTPRPEILSERFDDALVLAADAHRKQHRKGSEIAYVGHLLGVCSMVIEEGGDEDMAIAALLHDIVEDQGGMPRLQEVRERFGDKVADIVLACTDTLEESVRGEQDSQARKDAYLAHLEHQPPEILIVSLADKLYNARAIRRDYIEIGEDLWERFNSKRDGTLRYYQNLSATFSRVLPTCRMTKELEHVVSSLTAEVGRHART